ncbi:hypothetical protein [Mesorhizobium escarrei]|uniref:hypothetical protein n=1 Tax=Mesorhizobium escarrei TaxID=666018 RepID=UPI0020A7704A|nr:hypothetical protein [Mesorhizobium escarrei]
MSFSIANSTPVGANSARPASGELFAVLLFCFPSTLVVLHVNADLTFGFCRFLTVQRSFRWQFILKTDCGNAEKSESNWRARDEHQAIRLPLQFAVAARSATAKRRKS